MTNPRTDSPPPRQGPRPLPLHLATASLSWLSSPAASAILRPGWPSSRPGLAARAAALAHDLAATAPEDFAAALDGEARRRLDRFLAGIEAYRRHPYRRTLAAPPVLWEEGTTRLLDYGATAPDAARGRPVLVVPSLINRAYVLDLAPGRSLLRYLARRGLRPLLVDWGAPGQDERRFGLDDYIGGRLAAALAHVRRTTDRPPAVIGYCMGGLLALALALHRPADVAGLVLLATPWDFHADAAVAARALAAAMAPHWPWIDRLGEIPVDLLQTLFAAVDPWLVVRKFTAFAGLEPGSVEAESFVALEDWVNDGVPLTAPAAHDTIVGWYGENRAARGEWTMAGTPIRPEALAVPTLALIPGQDRIVPPASAAALAAALPRATARRPPLGHIGMIVSRGARRAVWPGLFRWLAEV